MSVNSNTIRLGLPKGRMKDGVISLLGEAGIKVKSGSRSYRPSISLPGYEVKLLKPQNIIEMLQAGSRDIGFAGEDWVRELDADLVELLDLKLDPVKLVAAAPRDFLVDGKLPEKPLVIASEYQNITKNWIAEKGLDATFVRSYGATEVFPPEDADCIVDNTATGSTLKVNQLEITEVLLTSSTRFYANPKALENATRKAEIDKLVLLLQSVLEARSRMMIEVNVTKEHLDEVIALIPCMRKPTVSPLFGDDAFAIKAAVPRELLPQLIPEIKAKGGSDIIVTAPDQLVP